MAHSQLPYQCLKKLGNLLIAARGSSIDLLNAVDGTIVSSWDCPPFTSEPGGQEAIQKTAQRISPSVHGDKDTLVKKRKFSAPNGEDMEFDPKTSKKRKSNRSDAVGRGLDAPAVVIIEVSHHTEHVIAVTGEDKGIRVFEIVSDAGIEILSQISFRAMPKRPCALAITADGSTILSADKFGDVYSLPLIYSQNTATGAATTQKSWSTKAFVPAANELTIHSQRNRKALENQKRQTNQKLEKFEPLFEHKLLLGHVSMLTDIKLVTMNGRDYIISADRDEHIRISRGLPQTHIIEGFCLGHSDFVSRICIPSNKPDTLISGGGQDELFVWNWVSRQILSRTNLMKHIVASWSELFKAPGEAMDLEPSGTYPAEKLLICPGKLAISGIYHARVIANNSNIILVTCEAIPAIFTFILTSKGELEYIETIKLCGNVLAITTNLSLGEKDKLSIGQTQGIIVSIDNVHKPGFIAEFRDAGQSQLTSLYKFTFSGTYLVSHKEYWNPTTIDTYSNESLGALALDKLTNLLYNLENLRKREGDGQEE